MVMFEHTGRTPFYKIRETDLLYDIRLLQSALRENWGNYMGAYSVKTNALPWLLHYLKGHGFYAEVVSAEEYDLVRRLGYQDERIVYNGPIKERNIWEKILLAGGYVNLDSTQELEWIGSLAGEYPEREFSVGLRVNCDIASICPGEQLVEEEGGRFGYCYENGVLEEAVETLRRFSNIRIGGLHLHSSTQSRTVEVYGALARMAVRIAKELGLTLSYVDMGGGYFGGRPDKPDYRDYFREICRELKTYFDPRHTALIAEPGVSLVSRAITFETSVLDIKKIREQTYIVTDGSRVNLNPLVTRHVYPHHIVYEGGEEDGQRREKVSSQWICGSTCMEYDRLFEIQNGAALRPGDRIIYDTAGGYTMCLSPLFIHYFPEVLVEKEDGSLFVARQPWTNDEYLQKNSWE